MAVLADDLRDALRSFRRDRGYAATVVVTLALTIGATTAAFSIVNGVLLKPLAYPDAHRLVSLREIWWDFSDRIPTLNVNERHFDYWRQHARSFESLGQYVVRPANLSGGGDAAPVAVMRCSGTLFDVLGVQATIGRTLTARDESTEAPVAVIADSLWRERYAADPAVIGRALVLDGKPYTVVGVLPRGFRVPGDGQLTAAIDIAIPVRITVGWVGDHNDQAVARLRDGVSVDQARAELDVLQRQVAEIATKEAHQRITLASSVVPLAEYVVGRTRRALLLLLAAIGSVLLIACANLANLSLTRTLGRIREAAIRSALGASRRRLIRRLFLEQLTLALIGGAAGLWVAWLALRLFVRTAPIGLPRVDEIALDSRVIAFAAAAATVAGALVTLMPAWRIAGRDVQNALRATSTGTTRDRGALRSHAALLALQVALSVTLLVVTALFASSFVRVLNLDVGFTADRVLAVDVALPGARYADDRLREITYDRVLAAVRELPGVVRVSTASMLPLTGQGQVNFIAREGNTRPMSELPSANFRFVAPDFFRTLGIAVRRGRAFTDAERDPGRAAPAVISDSTARQLWPSEDPIGRRFNRGIPGEQLYEVVGIVGDARIASLDGAQPMMVYLPYWWRSRPSMSLLVKTALDPAALASGVRRAVGEIDPDIAVGESRPLDALVEAAHAGRRYQMQLFVVFGAAALFIATVGVYAVTIYGVARRRREMNIRVALGAQTSQVFGLVVRQGAAPIVAGVFAGIAGALAAGGAIATLLFEVPARDPKVIAAVAAIVSLVGVATCSLAARQGLSINPAAALRDE